MKKLSIIALVLSVLTVLMLLPAGAEKYSVVTDKKDALEGCTIKLVNLKKELDQTDTNVALINDGVYVADVGEKVYLNKAFVANAKTKPEGSNNYRTDNKDDFEYTLAGNKYCYYIQFDLAAAATVGSFSLWTTYETPNPDYDNHAPAHQVDSEFDILVSTDNGATWQVAWQSVRFSMTDDGKVKTQAGRTIEEGGNAKIVETKNDDGSVKTTARQIEGDFNKVYEGVTNVAYACGAARRDTGNDVDNTPFYYVIRMSEIDVYTAEAPAAPTTDPTTPTTDPVTPPPATGDGLAITVAVAAAALAAACLVLKKKEN